MHLFIGIVSTCLVGYLFFGYACTGLILSPLIIVYLKLVKKSIVSKRKNKLLLEFCQMLECIESLLKTGNSIELALGKVVEELVNLQGESSFMLKEVKFMNACIEMDVGVEDVFRKFASRAGISYIDNFADVFAISKRSDGNLIKVIQTVCNCIREDLDSKRQIRMSLSGVLQEITIMKIMPIGILIYLRMFSDNYYHVVYKNMAGQFIMASILVIYIVVCISICHMQRKVLDS